MTILFSDRGLPKSYRHVHGFGSHTYSFINAKNERFWVKFHFKTMQGIQNLTDSEAAKLVGDDRETHQRDLFEAIERKEFPKWKFYVQVMPERDAEKTPYNPFDLTKVWPHRARSTTSTVVKHENAGDDLLSYVSHDLVTSHYGDPYSLGTSRVERRARDAPF